MVRVNSRSFGKTGSGLRSTFSGRAVDAIHSLSQWLAYLRQPASMFGIAIVAICWAALAVQLSVERAAAIDAAIDRGSGLLRLFEETAIRQFKSVDQQLLFLRVAYEQAPNRFDLFHWVARASVVSDVTTEVGLIDPDGYLRTKTGYAGPPINLNDRKHFQVQIDAKADELYISEPVILRSTGQSSIQLTRRLNKPDGSFGGVIVASIDPAFVEQFRDLMKLGDHSNVSMRGFDGVLRASSGFSTPPIHMSKVMADMLTRSSQGYFWGRGVQDGIDRLVSYRIVTGYPFFISVGEAEANILAGYRLHRTIYIVLGAILTLLVLFTTIISIRRQLGLELINNRFSAALKNMSQGLSLFDADCRLVAYNEKFLQIYQMPPERVGLGSSLREILELVGAVGNFSGDIDSFADDLKTRISQGERVVSTRRLTDGRSVFVVNCATGDGGWVATHDDITERTNTEARIEQLAHFDALTSLANRNLFRERIEESLARLKRLNAEFAVFLLDLDRFKAVNDTFGHQIGDLLLKEVANRIKETIREVDVAARLGGDEFALIILPGKDALQAGAVTLAARLVDTISAPYKIEGLNVVIGCSIGIALAPEHGTISDELLKNADLALYKSKHAGRNCSHIYCDEFKAEADGRNALENDLRQAIWREEFELFYQPVVDLRTGIIIAVEALLRWRHPSKGIIAPGEFIPLAEETGLIVQLGEWALLKACHDATEMPDRIKVAVNLSPIQFSKSNIVDVTLFALADSMLEPGRLELEITEGVILTESEQNLDTLRQLTSVGVSIALDDFGVGYSSLSYLTSFKFNKVKIDKSFIDKIDKPETKAIISSIVQLAHSLNLATVVEGIETEAQLAEVRALGVNYAQGYLFARPAPLADLSLIADYPIGTSKAA